MKNPNGFGSVVKLSGNRRNPFAVRKTVGWDERAYPIYETIGYYPTRETGMIALAEYNKSPWDIDAEKTTLASLYLLWSDKKLCRMSTASQAALRVAYKHAKPLWDMKYRSIKSFHMQDCIDGCGRGYSTQGAIKNLFGHLDHFALEVDVIDKGYAQLTNAEPIPETKKLPFTEEEVSLLWSHQDDPWVDSILAFIYTGFRLSELMTMETSSVDLMENTMQGGVKTKAGKDRIVPIHPLIQKIIERRVGEGNKYLFSHNGKKINLTTFYVMWDNVMNDLNLSHTPHECRHTFRSKLDSAGANKKCIDLMMGHKSKGVGERIYTHKTIEELREAIQLIK